MARTHGFIYRNPRRTGQSKNGSSRVATTGMAETIRSEHVQAVMIGFTSQHDPSADPMGGTVPRLNLGIAYALALPIGWDREQEERSAGIRTFPLVAAAACGFVLVAIRILGPDSIGQARILEGLITGVGFIGGGAILKHGTQASGTATAASLWATGALGAAVGYGLYDIAAILSLVTLQVDKGRSGGCVIWY